MQQNDIWQVFAGGRFFKVDFVELTNWIAQNSLLPSDLVRKGNLRWIEAGKIPALQKYFSGELRPLENPQLEEKAIQFNLEVCFFHEKKEAVFICKKCVKSFCETCPKHYVKIQNCPVCVDCNHKKEIVHDLIKARFCPLCSDIIEKRNLPPKMEQAKLPTFEKLRQMLASK